MNTATAAFEALKAEMDGLVAGDLPALLDATETLGMSCIDQSEEVEGVDRTYTIDDANMRAQLVYLGFRADVGEADRFTLNLSLLDGDEIIDCVEIEEMKGAIAA